MHKTTQKTLEENFEKIEDYAFCHRDAVEILCADSRRMALVTLEEYERLVLGAARARRLADQLLRALDGEIDAGEADEEEADAGNSDAGVTDAGEADEEETDAGKTDAGEADELNAGEPSAGDTDAGEANAGDTDAGEANVR